MTTARRRTEAAGHVLFLLAVLCLFGASRCARGVKPDQAAFAAEAGDYTALISSDGPSAEMSGCGRQHQAQDGYLYCRVATGPIGDLSLTFIAPPVECGDEPFCVSFTIYDPTGIRPPYSDQIPKGQTRRSVPWKKLTGSDNFSPGDRGFWPFVYEILWLDNEKRLRKTVSEGEVRLRVYRTEICDPDGNCRLYEPLAEAPSNRFFVWDWVEKWGAKEQRIKMTTSARTWVQ